MGYRINYDIWGKMSQISRKKKLLKMCFWVFAAAVVGFFVFYGSAFHSAVSALEVMAQEIQEGSGIKEAFSEFCIDILEGAELG